MEQERVYIERERLRYKDRGGWGMQISFLKKKKRRKKKEEIKSNHGCETLPGIPDQCRTPERPRKAHNHQHTPSRTKLIKK